MVKVESYEELGIFCSASTFQFYPTNKTRAGAPSGEPALRLP
jgi:hypothetical protein